MAPVQIEQTLTGVIGPRPSSRKLARVRFRLPERGEGAINPDHGIDIAEARLDSADRVAAHKHDRAARMALSSLHWPDGRLSAARFRSR